MTKRQPKALASVQSILGKHLPEICALTERLRTIIREAAPKASESAHVGWHSLSYHHPHSGYFCGLFPRAESVMLVFEFGILLVDSDGVLEGNGKQVRYLTFRHTKDIRVRALKKLLRAALDLPSERSVKLELIRSQSKQL